MKHDHLEVPGRRVPLPEWPGTSSEQRELSQACTRYFEECSCHPDYDWHGRVVAIHVCVLHQFLIEKDDACNRIQRLVFARRLKLRWQAQEFRMAPAPKVEPDEEDLPW